MSKKETLFSYPIREFCGLNTNDDTTSLKAGESPYMKNFRITQGGSLAKRDGYIQLYDFGGSPRAVILAHFNSDEYIFAAVGEKIYSAPLPFDVSKVRKAGEVGKSDNCFFMQYGGKVYILGGGKIQYYDTDTESFTAISPYRPLIAVSCGAADLSGTPLEGINLLTGAVRKQFSPTEPGDRTFKLHKIACASVDYVKYNGRTVKADNYYVTDDCSSVVINSDYGMEAGINNVEIGYTLKDVSENYDKIINCRHFMFYGGENDTKIFLWGNPEYPDARFHSETADGDISEIYFPENNFTRIGDGSKICDIIRQYDRQIIFCENAAYISYIETKTDILGRNYFSFPVRTISDTVGSSVCAQSKLIDNIPVTLTKDGIYKWVSTSQRDERNTHNISSRINSLLCDEDIPSAAMFDYAHNGELFIYFPNGRIYIYNYRNDTFFLYDNIFAHTFLEDSAGNLYFCDVNGRLCMFTDVASDNGKPIDCVWHSGYMDMGYFGRKNLYNLGISFHPYNNTAFAVSWLSDTDTDTYDTAPYVIKSRIMDFSAFSFNSFSFRTAHSLKNCKYRMRTKRFRHLKIIIKNNSSSNRIHISRISLNGKNTDY